MFNLVKYAWRAVTKVISWGLRRIGTGIIDISVNVAKAGIDVTDYAIVSTIGSSVDEIDRYGLFDNYNKKDLVKISDMVETSDSMHRTYRTLYEVDIVNPQTLEITKQYASIYHDYNTTGAELDKKLRQKLGDKEQYQERIGTTIGTVRRVQVWHKKGASY